MYYCSIEEEEYLNHFYGDRKTPFGVIDLRVLARLFNIYNSNSWPNALELLNQGHSTEHYKIRSMDNAIKVSMSCNTDDYFYVIIIPLGHIPVYFECDQRDGLINCLSAELPLVFPSE